MAATETEQQVTLCMFNDIPSQMTYAGRRWRVTDMPTRLRHSGLTVLPGEVHSGLYGWRFQGTDDDGVSLVFDVYRAEDGWHVHRSYS